MHVQLTSYRLFEHFMTFRIYIYYVSRLFYVRCIPLGAEKSQRVQWKRFNGRHPNPPRVLPSWWSPTDFLRSYVLFPTFSQHRRQSTKSWEDSGGKMCKVLDKSSVIIRISSIFWHHNSAFRACTHLCLSNNIWELSSRKNRKFYDRTLRFQCLRFCESALSSFSLTASELIPANRTFSFFWRIVLFF